MYNNIETPALIVDKKTLEQNMETMRGMLMMSNMKLRPHYKSHKCSAIAKMQMEYGAIGMTCSKLSELEDLVDIGIEDILVANQIVDKSKIARVAYLAKNSHITVCVDNEENIRDLSNAAVLADSVIHCLVEYDIGMERCGVTTQEDVLRLARLIEEMPCLEFDGLQAYAGHLSHVVELGERVERTQENHEKLRSLIAFLKDNGVEIEILSGGSTGTSEIKASYGLYTELQAGSYIFMDSTYSQLDVPFKNSLYVLTTVVSCRDGLVVVDAGVKTCGVDQGMPKPFSIDVEEIVASEEHFQLHNHKADLKVGDRLLLIPGHCCSTVNLYDKIYLVDDGKVVNRFNITARGMGR